MDMITIEGLNASAARIGLGMMRAAELDGRATDELIDTALAEGINLFDHADIYGGGESERRFGQALRRRPGLREKMLIQTKCGVREGRYDLSGAHILASAEASLERLGIDTIDLFLLHRPDALMEPEEVAEAFSRLRSSGKVRRFGVSNFDAGQIRLLQSALPEPIAVNQLQFSAAHTHLIDHDMSMNMNTPAAPDRCGGTLDYCRLMGICVQTWSSLQYGYFEGTFLGSDRYADLNRALARAGDEMGVTSGAAAIAWILRHPAKMQAIIGTTKPARVHELCAALHCGMSREMWYAIYTAAGNMLP